VEFLVFWGVGWEVYGGFEGWIRVCETGRGLLVWGSSVVDGAFLIVSHFIAKTTNSTSFWSD
jgi:hypothetical protein